MGIKRRKSKITGKWVWDIINESGVVVSTHYHSKNEAREALGKEQMSINMMQHHSDASGRYCIKCGGDWPCYVGEYVANLGEEKRSRDIAHDYRTLTASEFCKKYGSMFDDALIKMIDEGLESLFLTPR